MEKKQLKIYFLSAILLNSLSEKTRNAFEKYLDHDSLFNNVSKSFHKFLTDLRLTDLKSDEEDLILYLYTDNLARKILQELLSFDIERVYEKFKIKNRNPLMHIISLNINPLISSKKEFQKLIDSAESEHRFLFYLIYRNDQKDKFRGELLKKVNIELARRKIKATKLNSEPIHYKEYLQVTDLMEQKGIRFNTALKEIFANQKNKERNISSIKTSFPKFSKKQITGGGKYKSLAERFLKIHDPNWLKSYYKKSTDLG